MPTELILDYLSHLKHLRYEFKDDIPEKILHSNSPNSNYKVRKSWFVGVVADATNIITDGYATNTSKQIYKEFVDKYWSTNISQLTTEEEIKEANKLLDHLIGDLEKLSSN